MTISFVLLTSAAALIGALAFALHHHLRGEALREAYDRLYASDDVIQGDYATEEAEDLAFKSPDIPNSSQTTEEKVTTAIIGSTFRSAGPGNKYFGGPIPRSDVPDPNPLAWGEFDTGRDFFCTMPSVEREQLVIKMDPRSGNEAVRVQAQAPQDWVFVDSHGKFQKMSLSIQGRVLATETLKRPFIAGTPKTRTGSQS